MTASWSASGASSYTLYHATTPLAGATDLDTRASGITRRRLTDLTGTAYTVFTGLTNGTTYYFVVRAENSLGQKSAPSVQASAIPLATPTGLSLTADNAQVTAGWSAASGASSYTLYYATTPLTDPPTAVSGVTRLTGLTGTSRTVTGLTNGVTYYFRVRAVNASGQSAPSTQASAAPALTTFRDALKDGGQGPEMVTLPTGSFRMGSPSTEAERHSSEGPVRTVTISNRIAIGRYEVTFAEYDRFARATGRTLPSDEGGGRGTRPVFNVSHTDAEIYATWLGEQTGKIYRLPTEAEWEYAARAHTSTRYSWGDNITCSQARYGHNSSGGACSNNPTGPVAVGSFTANPFGLYDMHGNVLEWVRDCSHRNYEGAPTDGSAWMSNCSNNPLSVVRGGGWHSHPKGLRSAYRNNYWTFKSQNDIGFRLVQDINP